MIIDGKVIDGVKNPDGSYNYDELSLLLANIIMIDRMPKNERYDRLYNYYRGKHDILDRQRKSKGAANNRLVANFPKYITEMTTAFVVGNPVTYTSPVDDEQLAAIREQYRRNDIGTLDAELEKSMSIYGKGYELIYADDESKPRSCIVDVRNAFVCYTDTATYTPVWGVHYYVRRNIMGFCIGIVCRVYTDTEIITMECESENWAAMHMTSVEPHYFGIVPLIEYRNNKAEMGDFEDVITLIDAYERLQSDRLNDKEQFVDAFLFLRNCDIDATQAEELREEKILMGLEDADAKYLSKVLAEADTEILRNSLREDILTFAMVPDMSDQHFGTQISGVAMRYKILSILQHTEDKARYFTKGLRKRLTAYRNFMQIRQAVGAVDIELVEVVFTPNVPANTLETAQYIDLLSGKVSNKTLISQLDFITDAAAEEEAVEQERQAALDMQAEAMAAYDIGGGKDGDNN